MKNPSIQLPDHEPEHEPEHEIASTPTSTSLDAAPTESTKPAKKTRQPKEPKEPKPPKEPKAPKEPRKRSTASSKIKPIEQLTSETPLHIQQPDLPLTTMLNSDTLEQQSITTATAVPTSDTTFNNNNDDTLLTAIAKKNRKPKNGKIVNQLCVPQTTVVPKQNIILLLKCFMTDLEKESDIVFQQAGDFTTKYCLFSGSNNVGSGTGSGIADDNSSAMCNENGETVCTGLEQYSPNLPLPISSNGTSQSTSITTASAAAAMALSMADRKSPIWEKLKQLKRNLHINNNASDKKSACFFDTCPFDNPPVHIPKYYHKGVYHVYGCFCCPECAVAHLMREPIDDSVRFERYSLLNKLYGGIYECAESIKPAPDPHYMLDKFYGNLSITEYRDMLSGSHLLFIVDKPLTGVMPELHEDNGHILKSKIIPSAKSNRVHRANTKKDIIERDFQMNGGGGVSIAVK